MSIGPAPETIDGLGEPTPGTLLAGKYRVEGVVGRGGMGVVLAAHDVALDRRVAIKLLLRSTMADPSAIPRFLREARAAARLESEHVASVLDLGTIESGVPYIAMEFLEGTDLEAEVTRRGPLPIAEAVDHVLCTIDALAEAHAHGIVHRDLKPQNIFLARRADGTTKIKVLDFGLSKALNAPELVSGNFPPRGELASLPGLNADPAAGFGITVSGTVMGSPGYMSPEQIMSAASVDARTDLWSLGVVLYELLTGRAPFNGTTVTELFAAILHSEPTPIRFGRPEVPVALEQAIFRCLRRDPNERYAGTADLARALAPFGSGRHDDIVVRAAVLEGSAAADQPRAPSPSRYSEAAGAGDALRRRAGIVVVLAGAVLALAFGAVWWVRTAVEPPAQGPLSESAPSAATAASQEPAPAVAPAESPPAQSASTSGPSSAPSSPGTATSAPAKSQPPHKPSGTNPDQPSSSIFDRH